MSMFGLGMQELIIVAIVALLLFGKRLPEVARTAGGYYNKFRKQISDLQAQINLSDLNSSYPTGHSSSSYTPSSSSNSYEPYSEYEAATAPRYEPPPAEAASSPPVSAAAKPEAGPATSPAERQP